MTGAIVTPIVARRVQSRAVSDRRIQLLNKVTVSVELDIHAGALDICTKNVICNTEVTTGSKNLDRIVLVVTVVVSFKVNAVDSDRQVGVGSGKR